MKKPDKLHFATAGIPACIKTGGYIKGLEYNHQNNLMGMELEFVHGVKMKAENIPLIKEFAEHKGMLISAHSPYYVNLNAKESEKIEASIKRITDTARMAYQCGGYSITFHAAYYMDQDHEKVYQKVKSAMQEIVAILKDENIEIWLRPETTGKATQFGTLEEIVRLSQEVEMVMPCVDFSHMHARVNGYNGYDNFSKTLEFIQKELGNEALQSFHGHVAGIEYTAKGERRHLNLEESDFKYKELLQSLLGFGVKGILVCESPNIEQDSKLLEETFKSMQ